MTENPTIHPALGGPASSDYADSEARYEKPDTSPPPPREPGPPRPRASGPLRRRVIAIVAAVLALMLGSGVIGGWAATELAGSSVAPAAAAPVQHAPPGGSLADVVATAQRSVVSITTGAGEGSGVTLDTSGHILTNNHVIASAQGGEMTVTFEDGTSQQASIVGTDPQSDLAVIKVDDGSNLTPATFADSDTAEVGDQVLALGSPLGLEGTVTSGVISAKDRTINEGGQPGPQQAGATAISGLLQTDAAINPGNSGGALVDTAGQVVGINTAIATTGNGGGNIGVGFAIPSNTAKSVAEQLIKGEQVAHPYLGVSIAQAGGSGAIIRVVDPAGPAAQAGLEQGDVITKIGDMTVNTPPDDVKSAVQGAEVGQQITITYTRGGAENTVTVTLADTP